MTSTPKSRATRMSISHICLISVERMVPLGERVTTLQVHAWAIEHMQTELAGRTLLTNHVSASLNAHWKTGHLARTVAGKTIRYARTDKAYDGHTSQARKPGTETTTRVDIDIQRWLSPCLAPPRLAPECAGSMATARLVIGRDSLRMESEPVRGRPRR